MLTNLLKANIFKIYSSDIQYKESKQYISKDCDNCFNKNRRENNYEIIYFAK